ncbi:hypothetical protein BX600DRAFT_530565 [Xylariales sp. PMI_506]|nr:hypothetical protein BX600DRAFT_530565 [Xylariales sp. PMI_506]
MSAKVERQYFISTNFVVSQAEWLTARKELLEKEKAHLRASDDLAAQRRALPMVKITKEYTFTAPDGRTLTLRDLFNGKRQLLVYHFMFDPAADVSCSGCAFVGTHIPDRCHLRSRDTELACVSRAPADKLERFKARNGWAFPWYSCGERGDFNYDFQATLDPEREDGGEVMYNYRTSKEREALGKSPWTKGDFPGMSVFLLQDGEVYHTYSTYERGLEVMLTTLRLLDLTPLGRQDGPYGPGSFRLQCEYGPED